MPRPAAPRPPCPTGPDPASPRPPCLSKPVVAIPRPPIRNPPDQNSPDLAPPCLDRLAMLRPASPRRDRLASPRPTGPYLDRLSAPYRTRPRPPHRTLPRRAIPNRTMTALTNSRSGTAAPPLSLTHAAAFSALSAAIRNSATSSGSRSQTSPANPHTPSYRLIHRSRSAAA